VLKLKFQRLHETVVRSVNADPIIDRLFSVGIIGDDDMHWLQLQGSRRQQCRSMLCLLHGMGNPQAFVNLYLAIKEESYLHYLIEKVDEFTDDSVKDLQQATRSRESRGLNFF